MIVLRLAGEHNLTRDLRKMLTDLQDGPDTGPVLEIADIDAIRRLSSGDLLVTTPLLARDLEALRPARIDGLPRWVVVSPKPDFAEAIAQIAKGASDYIPGGQPIPVIARRLLYGLRSIEAPASDPATHETLLALFDFETPEQQGSWDSHLARIATVLGVDLLALVLADEPAHRYAPDAVARERLEELLVVPFPLTSRSNAHLLLGRTRKRANRLESLAMLAMVVGRLLGQQLQRSELLRKIMGAKQEWEATVDAIQDPMVLVDPGGRVLRSNLAFASLVGREVREVVDQPIHMLVGSRPDESWWHVTGVGTAARAARTFPVAPERFFEVHSLELVRRRDGLIVYMRDVTEERRLTSLVMQRERFAALGELADGIFHDLNNLAAIVQPELACARRILPPLREALEPLIAGSPEAADLREELTVLGQSLEGAAAATGRLEELLSNLRQYTRLRQDITRSTPSRQPLDLNMLLRALPVLFNARLRQKGAVLTLELDDIPLVEGQAGELMRVFENLIKNALEAIEDGGRIDVRTLERGGRVLVQVEDTGHGVPPESLGRIFERGFTTRQQEGGTGLGLHICREVLLAHGGDLSVASQWGRGTTFVAELPVFGDDETY